MDVDQLIADLGKLGLDPAKLDPIVERLRAEGLTDELRTVVDRLLADAEQEATTMTAVLGSTEKILTDTSAKLAAVDQEENQAALDLANQATAELSALASPPSAPIITPSALPTPAVLPSTPPLPADLKIAPTPTLPAAVVTPLAPAAPSVAPAPQPAPVAPATPPPADDTTDWLSLLNDLNEPNIPPAAAPAPVMPPVTPAPVTSALPPVESTPPAVPTSVGTPSSASPPAAPAAPPVPPVQP